MRAKTLAVVVTSANEGQAHAFRSELEHRPQLTAASPFERIVWLSVSDPLGARIGSGGGTLNALIAAELELQGNIDDTLVIVIHSGGDSRRSPSQSVCGKAWSKLPRLRHGRLEAPFDILVQQLRYLCDDAPGCVVACSDVLLVLPESGMKGQLAGREMATGLAIRAPLDYGPKHGVYVVNSHGRVTRFLQKASVQELESAGAVHDGKVPLDSGVLYLSPRGVRLFTTAAKSELRNATSLGDGTMRIELYSDIMQAFQGGGFHTYDAYAQMPADDPSPTFRHVLWHLLSTEKLNAYVAPATADFRHLGTSREYVDLLVSERDAPVRSVFDFVNRAACVAPPGQSNVVLNSILGASVSLGAGAVVEHSLLDKALHVGDHALCSCLRTSVGLNSIPPRCLVQQIKLLDGRFVCICFGIDDDIKNTHTFLNKPIAISANSLWSAKLFNPQPSPEDSLRAATELFSSTPTESAAHLSMSEVVDLADKSADFEWRAILERRVDLITINEADDDRLQVAARRGDLRKLVQKALDDGNYIVAAKLASYARGCRDLPFAADNDDLDGAKAALFADPLNRAAALRFARACIRHAKTGGGVNHNATTTSTEKDAVVAIATSAFKPVVFNNTQACAVCFVAPTRAECVAATSGRRVDDCVVTDQPVRALVRARTQYKRVVVAVSVAGSALAPSAKLAQHCQRGTMLDELLSAIHLKAEAAWLCWCGCSTDYFDRLDQSSASVAMLVDGQGSFAGVVRVAKHATVSDTDTLEDLMRRAELIRANVRTRALVPPGILYNHAETIESIVEAQVSLGHEARLSQCHIRPGSRIGDRSICVGLDGIVEIPPDVEVLRLPLTDGWVCLVKGLQDDVEGDEWCGSKIRDTFYPEDAIWDVTETRRCLFTARLFAVGSDEDDLQRLPNDDWLSLQKQRRVSIDDALKRLDIDRLVDSSRRLLVTQVEAMCRLSNLQTAVLPALRLLDPDTAASFLEAMVASKGDDLTFMARALSLISQLYDGSEAYRNEEDGTNSLLIDDPFVSVLEEMRSGSLKRSISALATTRRSLVRYVDSIGARSFVERAYGTASMTVVRHALLTRSTKSVKYATQQPTFGAFRVSAPARIDLGGGWTDTPPIAYELGGAVTNVAIRLDGHRPIGCDARRFESDDPCIILSSGDESAIIREASDLNDRSDPCSACALLKCCIAVRGVLDRVKLDSSLELRTWSLLPTGTGLGTSSILAACAVAALDACFGLTVPDKAELIEAAALVEQELTTAGGFQDNVGGVYGGAKVTYCEPSLPLRVGIDQIDSPLTVISERILLLYTGRSRLAKGLLENVLRRWHARIPGVVDAAHQLLETSKRATAALKADDADDLGAVLDDYWRLKKTMAAADVEPENVARIIQALRPYISGASLCGAGGGGFLAVVLKSSLDNSSFAHLLPNITSYVDSADLARLRFYRPTVDPCGLLVDKLDDADWLKGKPVLQQDSLGAT